MLYHLMLFLHILGAMLLVTGSGLSSTLQAAAKRTNKPAELKFIAGLFPRVPMLTAPGALTAIVTATIIVWTMGYGFATPWVAGSYACWVVAFVTPMVVFRPILAELPAILARIPDDATEAPELKALFTDRKVFVTSRVLEVITLVMIGLMVFKPGA